MNDRDEFAKAAMAAMLASWYEGDTSRLFDFEKLADDAYDAADAMLKRRDADNG